MQRKFLTNLALLLFLNILVKPFWIFGIDRSVQNIVGTVDYGFYFSIFNFAFLFSILLDAGITNFNNRNIARHHQLLGKHFSSIVILKFLLAVVYTVVIFIVALIIGYNEVQLKLLAWVAFNNFLLSFILYLRSNISGLLMFRTDSVLSVLDRLFMIAICSVLLWGNVTTTTFRIEWFVYAQTAAYMLTLLIALTIVIRKAAFKRLKWNRPFFMMIMKRSAPFALLVLLMSVYNRVDSVFIERLLPGDTGYQQSGVYAMAFRLLDAANQMAFLFAVLLLPIYSRMLKEKQYIENMVKLPFTILITIAAIVAIGSLFYKHEIMGLLYTRYTGETIAGYANRINESGQIFGILMFGFLGTVMMYVFSTLLTANGNLKQLNIIAAVGILINFSMNILLIPAYQALGSAYASLTTQLITGISFVIIVQYYFRFSINYKYLFRIIAFFAGVVLINYLSGLMPYHWLIGFSIMIALSLTLAFVLKLMSIRSFIAILKER